MFTSDQQEALDACDRNRLVFISGPGGTGKSFLIHHLKKTYDGAVHILSSTGISAYHIGGMTVHSFLARIKMVESEFFLPLGESDLLIVDEVSMLGKKVFDEFEETLRLVRSENRSFGGLKVLFFGDFAQLPPVNDEFCFESVRWPEIERTVELHEIKRQTDRSFVEFLLRIRSGKLGSADRTAVQAYGKVSPGPKAVHLFASNEEAQTYNAERLRELCAETEQNPYPFPALIESECFSESEIDSFFAQRHQFLRSMDICRGARVMLTKNICVEEGWCNGTVGTVQSVGKDSFVLLRSDKATAGDRAGRVQPHQVRPGVRRLRPIRLSDAPVRPEVPVPASTHGPRKGSVCGAENCKRHPQSEVAYLDGEAVDKRAKQFLAVRQFPAVLAWGMTIHKSQGMTLDECAIHLPAYRYCPSLIYVALSRCTSSEGVSIRSPTPIKYDAICPDPAIMSRVFRYRRKDCSVCGEEFLGPYAFCSDCACCPGKHSIYSFKAFVQNMTPERERYAEFALERPEYSSSTRWRKFVAFLRTVFQFD
jgi:ATP-dependent DNA helicase PIF1